MAIETLQEDGLKLIVLTAKETANLIGLLAAQLGDVPLANHQAGATPIVNVVEDGKIKYRLALMVGRDPKVG